MRAATLCALLLLAPLAALAAPQPGDLASRGQQAFVHRCSMCHREGGTGTFILARRLGAEKSLLEKRADLQALYVRTVVRWGVGNMPRISRVELPETDMDAVVAYLTAPKGNAAP